MSANTLKGNLKEFKEKVKEKWGDIADNDRDSLSGDVNQLAELLQKRLGYAKEQASTAAQEFMNNFKDSAKDNNKGGDSDMKNNSGMMKNADQATDKISDIGKDVCDKTVEVAKQVKEDVGEYGKAAADFVKHKPYQSIAIAAVAGLALGLMFRKN